MKRSTIKNDPFALVVPEPAEARDEPPPVPAPTPAPPPVPRSDPHRKERLTVHLTHDLIERGKNAAYWNPRLTIAGIAERGIVGAIAEVEQENGGPYPPREGELKGGRPIGSKPSGTP
jgi:hypothetical protein